MHNQPPSLSLKRTHSHDADFRNLIRLLDADLGRRYGQLMDFYGAYNVIEDLDTVVVAYLNGEPAGCGCFKVIADHTTELKRMYVAESGRQKGIARAIINELETWAKQSGHTHMRLEYGTNQPEASKLYTSAGYQVIENYGQYAGVDTSICMEKVL